LPEKKEIKMVGVAADSNAAVFFFPSIDQIEKRAFDY
jgi:hypothetical protein